MHSILKGRDAGLLRQMLRLAAPHVGWLFAAIGGALGSTAFDLLRLHYIRLLVDTALEGDLRRSPILLAWLGGAIVVGIVATRFSGYAPQRLATCVASDLRRSFAASVAYGRLDAVERHRPGDLVSRLDEDVGAIARFMGGGFSRLLYQPLTAACALVYLCALDWRLLCICFAVTPISAWLILRTSRREARLFAVLLGSRGRMASRLRDALDNIDSVKSYALEQTIAGRFAADSRRVMATETQLERIGRRLLFLILSVSDFPDALAVIAGGALALRGHVSLGSLLVFMKLMGYVTNPSSHTYTNIRDWRKAGEALGRVREITGLREEAPPAAPARMPAGDAVDLHRVSFSYSSATPVLTGLSLRVPTTGLTAVVGPSGCGKTTLLLLICGLHRPISGEIRVAAPAAYVDQDAYLFSGTVEENIRYGRHGAGPEEVVRAARSADAHEFIQALPHGYATRVGERGVRLSGGQRQRVALARALLCGARILCLDEPTASLDGPSEERVSRSLHEAARSSCVILTAHRLGTVRWADRIVVLEAGGVAEAGTHKALMEARSTYYRLFACQERIS